MTLKKAESDRPKRGGEGKREVAERLRLWPSELPAPPFVKSERAMSGKAGLYATSLDAARRANLYDHVCPVDSHGKVRQGSSRTHHSPDGLEWKELVRKFSKHNPQREGAPVTLYMTGIRKLNSGE